MKVATFSDNSPPSPDATLPTGPIWTPIRRELRAWLREKAPSLAPSYEGAVALFNDVSFPGRLHFIAHAVRDIADRLVFALDPQMEGSRVQYEGELDKIEKEWPGLDQHYRGGASPSVSDTAEIPVTIAKRIDQLVAAHRARRARPSHYELLFRFLMREHPLNAEVNKRAVESNAIKLTQPAS